MEMFKKILENSKALFKKNGNKKLIERVAIIGLIGAMLLIAGSTLFKKSPEDKLDSNTLVGLSNANDTSNSSDASNGTEINSNDGSIETFNQSSQDPQNEMENRLKSILTKINGAGKVDVMVTFYSGNESIPAVDVNTSENNTHEKDKEGGTREIKQTDKESTTVYQEIDGKKKPFIIKEILPKVKGVVVVADGAEDAEVKANLAKATQALLDIAAHKIQVFQRSGN